MVKQKSEQLQPVRQCYSKLSQYERESKANGYQLDNPAKWSKSGFESAGAPERLLQGR